MLRQVLEHARLIATPTSHRFLVLKSTSIWGLGKYWLQLRHDSCARYAVRCSRPPRHK
jgi:hypothetical protein